MGNVLDPISPLGVTCRSPVWTPWRRASSIAIAPWRCRRPMLWSVAWIQRRVPRWAEILGVVRGGVDRFYGLIWARDQVRSFNVSIVYVDGHQPNIRVSLMYILPPLFPIKGGMTIPNIRSWSTRPNSTYIERWFLKLVVRWWRLEMILYCWCFRNPANQ